MRINTGRSNVLHLQVSFAYVSSQTLLCSVFSEQTKFTSTSAIVILSFKATVLEISGRPVVPDD